VRIERVAAVERMRDPNATPFTKPRDALMRAKARFRQAELAYQQLVAAKDAAAAKDEGAAAERKPMNNASASNASTGASSSSEPTWQPKPLVLLDEFDAMCRAMPNLQHNLGATNVARGRAESMPFVLSEIRLKGRLRSRETGRLERRQHYSL
jgi:hypothetical protein